MTWEENTISRPSRDPVPPASEVRPDWSRSLRMPLLVLAAGIAVLGMAGLLEQRMQARVPLRDALMATADSPPWEGMISTKIRHASPAAGSFRNTLIELIEDTSEGQDALEQFRINQGPRVVYLEKLPPEFEAALAWGRLPSPGKPEVLAGDLASPGAVSLDVVEFEVVGGLARGVPVFIDAYVLPRHVHFNALFDASTDAVPAWFDPEGKSRAAELLEQDALPAAPEVFEGGSARTAPWAAPASVFGLALMAGGGALAQIRLLRRLTGPASPLYLRRILADMTEYPRTTAAVHVLLYASFFAAMLGAIAVPRAAFHVMEWTRRMFSEGPLDYIGQAYASGNIVLASAATFSQNYFAATLLAAMLPSFIFPFWGVFKNIFSFLLAGFALSPIWTGMALNFTYHGITMVLEFEAYIVASIAVVLFPVHIVRGAAAGSVAAGLRRGGAAMATGAVLAGMMLAIAAVYEAATLIVLGGR